MAGGYHHPNLTENEHDFFEHMVRWGSTGYPVMKVKSGWIWQEFYGVKGAPVVYKTKRECVTAIEGYIDILRDKRAGRLPPSV